MLCWISGRSSFFPDLNPLIGTEATVLTLLFTECFLKNWSEVRQRKGYSDQIDADWILRFLQEYGVWKKTVFDRNSLHCLSSFFAASEITAPWVLFKASSSVASLLSLSLSTSNGLEKGPFFFSHLGCLGVSFSASEGPKVGLRSGIGITLCSQPLKEEGSLSLIQWMLESEVSRAFR